MLKIIESVASTENQNEANLFDDNVDYTQKSSNLQAEEVNYGKSNFFKKKKLKKKIYMLVFNANIKKKLKKSKISSSKVVKLIKKISKINIYEKNNENKIVYLGRTEDNYYKYAQQDSKGISFHIDDNYWNNLANKYGYDVLWLINNVLLNYVILKKWRIVLVSNPNDYYDIEKFEKKYNYFYSKELEVLCKFNITSWVKEGDFWNIIFLPKNKI